MREWIVSRAIVCVYTVLCACAATCGAAACLEQDIGSMVKAVAVGSSILVMACVLMTCCAEGDCFFAAGVAFLPVSSIIGGGFIGSLILYGTVIQNMLATVLLSSVFYMALFAIVVATMCCCCCSHAREDSRESPINIIVQP